MRLIIVRHGETHWTLAGRYTGATDVLLTANGRREAISVASLLDHVLDGQSPVVVSSPRQRATETATLALPEREPTIDPLVAECDYGDYEGLTSEQIGRRAPGWDIWRDGCPHGESTAAVGARADAFLRTTENCPGPLIVVTHGHFSRILVARTLGLAADYGRLFASLPASVSLIEDHHGERCLGLWNADAALLEHLAARMTHGNGQVYPLPATARNADAYFTRTDIDGGVVGSTSQEPSSFQALIEASRTTYGRPRPSAGTNSTVDTIHNHARRRSGVTKG